MSSHHFVKEDQEPALIIASVTHQTFEKIKPLLEWSPRIIVHYATLDSILNWGIKFDGVICTAALKSSFEKKLTEYEPLEWFIYSTSFLQETVAKVMTRNIAAVQIMDAHEDYPLVELERLKIHSVTLLTDSVRWSLIKSKKWRKWLPANSLIHVYGAGKTETISTAKADLLSIEKETIFWIGEPY